MRPCQALASVHMCTMRCLFKYCRKMQINSKSSTPQSGVSDWMAAIRKPTTYPLTLGNARLHLKHRLLAYVVMFTAAIIVLVLFLFPHSRKVPCIQVIDSEYNSTYPLSKPVGLKKGLKYRIALVTDLDTASASQTKKNTWFSYLKKGYLFASMDLKSFSITYDRDVIMLNSTLSQDGRGMELSELVVFNGNLYTVDDRTGVVYKIIDDQIMPWVLLEDGDGNVNKGFKSEWATVKNQRLYVGGLGKEWTSTQGVVQNLNPQWVKHIGIHGDVVHLDWHENYNAMRKHTGTLLPGESHYVVEWIWARLTPVTAMSTKSYMIHESGMWSDHHRKWFFLPRRLSKESYNELDDERCASNVMIMCDENFTNIQSVFVGTLNPTHGFSSFKFLPNSKDSIIVALKSEEDKGKVASYLLIFNLNGEILLPETKIGDMKYEGIEFI